MQCDSRESWQSLCTLLDALREKTPAVSIRSYFPNPKSQIRNSVRVHFHVIHENLSVGCIPEQSRAAGGVGGLVGSLDGPFARLGFAARPHLAPQNCLAVLIFALEFHRVPDVA